jgi:hypothetical protein
MKLEKVPQRAGRGYRQEIAARRIIVGDAVAVVT